jgi:hypothetical protein
VKTLNLSDSEIEKEITASLVVYAQQKIAEQLNPPNTITVPNIIASVFKAEGLNSLPEEVPPKPKTLQIPDPEFLKDPVKFVTKFKHWCNKKGKFKDGQGNEIQGIITGLTFPMLQVEVGDMTLAVSPADIQLIMEK